MLYFNLLKGKRYTYPQEFLNAIHWNCEQDLFDTTLSVENIEEIWRELISSWYDFEDLNQNLWNEYVYETMIDLGYELPLNDDDNE